MSLPIVNQPPLKNRFASEFKFNKNRLNHTKGRQHDRQNPKNTHHPLRPPIGPKDTNLTNKHKITK